MRALVGHVGAKMANKTGKMANMRGKMGARRRKGGDLGVEGNSVDASHGA